MKKLFYLAVLAVLLLPADLMAWGMTGHRIVAQIAQDNVKPSTRKKMDKLLGNMPIAYWANWPDFVKSDKTGKYDHTHTWHYVNTPANMSKGDFITYIKGIKEDNVYSAIQQLEGVIADKNTTDEAKREALIFLVHLVGDAHQPMHAGRAEDLGGNRVPVLWFSDKTNLHSVWDGKLIDYMKYSYTEYASLLEIMTDDEKKAIKNGTLEDWLFECHEVANELYDSVKPEDKLMFDYAYKYVPITEMQLQRAGLRLAVILDQIFK